MDVSLGLLADYANVTAEGKLNIMGVFQAINAPKLPYVHAQMHLILMIQAHRSESGKKKHIDIRLMGDDGPALFTIGVDMQVPTDHDSRFPGMPIGFNHILGFQNLRFEKPGDYEFAVSIGNEHKMSIPLRVIDANPGRPG